MTSYSPTFHIMLRKFAGYDSELSGRMNGNPAEKR